MRADASGIAPLPPQTGVRDRSRALLEWSDGRSVLHIGCVDSPFLREKFEAGSLLHARLATVAARTVGVDISAEGLDELRELVPGDYVDMDAEQMDLDRLPLDIDLVVAAEVIEHLANPGSFLRGLREYLQRTGAEAVITTPNAYNVANVTRFVLRRREYVHPDHVLLFSPVTLDKIVESAGLTIVERYGHAWTEPPAGQRPSARHQLLRRLNRMHPWLTPGLIWKVRSS